MKYQTLYLMVRVAVQSEHQNISDTVNEVETDTKITIKDTKKKREIVITNNETGESKTYLIPQGTRSKILDGAVLEAGDELTEGSVIPHGLLKIK